MCKINGVELIQFERLFEVNYFSGSLYYSTERDGRSLCPAVGDEEGRVIPNKLLYDYFANKPKIIQLFTK